MAARQFLWLVPALAALCGCGYSSDAGRSAVRAEDEDVVDADILTGASLVGMEPGRALGVFVEYRGEGEWSVNVSCDTAVTGYLCEWDVYAMVIGESPLEAEPIDIEEDWVVASSDEVALHTYTDYDYDGMVVRTAPGDALEFEVVLDALAAVRDTFPGRYVEWVGGEGVVHLGAPSNPVVLHPTEP